MQNLEFEVASDTPRRERGREGSSSLYLMMGFCKCFSLEEWDSV